MTLFRKGDTYFDPKRRMLSFNEGGGPLNIHLNWGKHRYFYLGLRFSPHRWLKIRTRIPYTGRLRWLFYTEDRRERNEAWQKDNP